jgi:hypothetical protein
VLATLRVTSVSVSAAPVLQSRKPYKHLHSGSCWENKKLLRHFKPAVTFQFRYMSFLSYPLSRKTLYSFTVLPSSSCTCVLSRQLSTLSYVTWCIFYFDTFPQFIPAPIFCYTIHNISIPFRRSPSRAMPGNPASLL